MRRIDGALERMIEYYYGQANFKVMLLSGGESLLPSATLRDFLGKEVITPGYSRQPIAFANAVLNGTALEFPEQSILFTAGALPIQFDAVCLIKGGKERAIVQSFTVSSGSASVFTFAAPLGSSSDAGFFVTSGTLPDGIPINGDLVINSVSGNTATILNNPTFSTIKATSLGAGDLAWQSLVGTIELPFDLRPDNGAGDRTFTIQPNQSHFVKIKLGLRVA